MAQLTRRANQQSIYRFPGVAFLNDASPSPETPPPRRRKAPPSPPKPDIAKKAHDLEAIKKALEDATSVGAGFWLSYLFLMFYLAIAAGAVTHVDLLLENPVRLPFLNVELPLKAFFFLAPILFLIVHMFTLSKLVILSDKARRFHEELSAQGVSEEDQEGLRRQLPSNIFVQGLAGPKSARESPFGWLMRAMGWMSMVIAPVLLLLLLLLQFLPYHDSWLTWELRLALLFDLALLWWLWRKVLSGDGGTTRSAKASVALHAAGGGASLVALAFAWIIATFPGEWPRPPWSHEIDLVFKALPWPKNALDLPELNIWEAFKLDDPKKLDWKDHTVNLKGRHLEGANFKSAKFGKADLRKVQLQGASLQLTQLQGALLDEAQLQGASLDEAQLQGASLDRAQLQGASVRRAQLQGASLDEAQLQGAELEGAHFRERRFWRRSCRARRLTERSFRARGFSERSFRARRFGGRGFRARRFGMPSSMPPTCKKLVLVALGLVGCAGDATLHHVVGLATRDCADRRQARALDARALRDAAREPRRRHPAGRNARRGAETHRDSPMRRGRLRYARGRQGAAGAARRGRRGRRELLGKRLREAGRSSSATATPTQSIFCAVHAFWIALPQRAPSAPALVDFIMSDKCPVSAALTDDDKSRLQATQARGGERLPAACSAAAPKSF